MSLTFNIFHISHAFERIQGYQNRIFLNNFICILHKRYHSVPYIIMYVIDTKQLCLIIIKTACLFRRATCNLCYSQGKSSTRCIYKIHFSFQKYFLWTRLVQLVGVMMLRVFPLNLRIIRNVVRDVFYWIYWTHFRFEKIHIYLTKVIEVSEYAI